MTMKWPAKGFEPQISNIQAFVTAAHPAAKNIIIDCNEILVLKADIRWHGSDKACKLDI